MCIYWGYLILAGLLEVVWAVFLKLSNGFTDPLHSVVAIIGLITSFYFLALATKVLPLGTSYAIWTGIGALGAMITGVIFFREPLTALRMFFALLLLISILGLKITSTH